MISERTLPPHPLAAERSRTTALGNYGHRILLFAIVVLAAVLNFAGLSREGYSNEFYAATVKSMSENWHNFFFNSFDPGGLVTIDKPPLAFWFQVAGVKLFGFSGTSLLLPEALAGPLALTSLAALPIVSTWTSTPVSAAGAKAATRTFKGPVEYVDHGPVQVSVVVKNKRITGVKVAFSPQDARSVFIQDRAIPILKQETLRAQSARIDEVSGATDVSIGYVDSLQAAIKTARQHRALK